MSKELDEAWTTIYHYNEEIIHDMGSEYVENPLKEEIDIVNNALLELKAIKEAKPSEALKELEQDIKGRVILAEDRQLKLCAVIKHALLKAQDNEKVLGIIKEKNVDIKLLKLSASWLDYYTRVKHKTGYNTELTEEEFDLLKRWLG